MEVSLDRLPVGIPAEVVQLRCSQAFCRRLQDFGLIPGTAVQIRYRSPDKGVAAVAFRDTVLALRCRDLKGVRVKWERRP